VDKNKSTSKGPGLKLPVLAHLRFQSVKTIAKAIMAMIWKAVSGNQKLHKSFFFNCLILRRYFLLLQPDFKTDIE
jgi:hypothetical protein